MYLNFCVLLAFVLVFGEVILPYAKELLQFVLWLHSSLCSKYCDIFQKNLVWYQS